MILYIKILYWYIFHILNKQKLDSQSKKKNQLFKIQMQTILKTVQNNNHKPNLKNKVTSLVYKVLQASQGRPDCICLGLVWLCLYLFIWSQILTLRGNPKDYSLLSRHFLSVTGKGLPSLSLVFHLLSHASLSPIPSEGSLLKTLLIPRETPTKSYPV